MGLVRTLLDDIGMDTDMVIPLHKVGSTILYFILQWCTYHKDAPAPVADKHKLINKISKWAKNFLDDEPDFLFEFIVAANYLDVPLLLENACKTVADMMKGKTSREIRRFFQIPTEDLPTIKPILYTL